MGLYSSTLLSQIEYSGVWQGILIRDGQKAEQGILFYALINIKDNTIEGKTREEILNSTSFAVKRIKGNVSANNLSLKQYVIEKQSQSEHASWCNIEAKLTYDDSTGYLSGTYSGIDCKRNTGKIILYKSTIVFSADKENPVRQSWVNLFFKELKKGYNAPNIRELERKNFVFEPIYFDYDQAVIKSEYEAYLLKIIRVVDSHTDLRIKITGNTDSDGSEEYNMELSKKRANALLDFFLTNGLTRNQIVIEFKGESNPIDSNHTPLGKQHNRRVDFSFI